MNKIAKDTDPKDTNPKDTNPKDTDPKDTNPKDTNPKDDDLRFKKLDEIIKKLDEIIIEDDFKNEPKEDSDFSIDKKSFLITTIIFVLGFVCYFLYKKNKVKNDNKA